jgi:hypothetical protein
MIPKSISKKTSKRLSTSAYRYTHAKHDPAQCTVPGLFQPLKKGARKGRNHSVSHKYGDVTMQIRCFEPLGADDLRVLQGLLAIGSPIGEPKVLTAEFSDGNIEHREIRKNLQLSETCLHLETLVVQGSCYQLAREIGMRTDGAANFRRIRDSLRRLCGVSIIAKYADGKEHSYNLIGGYGSDAQKREIHVVLNPRLTSAILGKRIDATGGHTRIEMDEVRRIKGDATRILHQYLCAIVSPGVSKEFLASTLRAHVWLQIPKPQKHKPEYSKWMERVKKQHQRIRQSMEELNTIGWKCTQLTDSRSNSHQTHYIKWQVLRPAIINVSAEEITIADEPIALRPKDDSCEISTPETPSMHTMSPPDDQTETNVTEITLKSPAKAIREFCDKLTDEQFAIAAEKQPTAAIKHALDRLTKEQFANAAALAPEAAMRYALDRLDAEQLSNAAIQDPTAALKFGLTKLSPEQFVSASRESQWPVGNRQVSDPQLDAWFEADAETAANHLESILGLKFPTMRSLIPKLSPLRLASCARTWPEAALNNAALLPTNLLIVIARNNPSLAIQTANQYIPPEIIDECILAAPAAAITYRFDHLSADQRKWCLKKSPWAAYALHRRDLSPLECEACLKATKAALPAKLDVIMRECPSAAMQLAREHLTPQQYFDCQYEVIRLNRLKSSENNDPKTFQK